MKPSTLRIGNRYRATRLKGPYDALVIGSGNGGLTAAALLSELGWRVAVLEQHYTAGGSTHSYERNGYEWDVGVHYIGDMGARTTARRLFDFVTSGKLDWAPMEERYDRFYLGDRVYEAKRRFIEEHRLVVWRAHDSWHTLRPDPVTMGTLKALAARFCQSLSSSRHSA